MALEELQNGRYRYLRLLGSGGMGEVYLMNDIRVSRQVAIKVTRSEGAPYPGSDTAKDTARLFQREARAIAALDHPNILPLYDFGEETHDDITMSYMVMPFCTEGSLTGWLQRGDDAARLSTQDIVHVVEQAADALQYAHDHQVIHLDVKPSNFLLRGNRKNPNRPTLLLADFGIARSSLTASNSSRTIRGTPTSMAPEQWSSMPVAATDQYALAVMVYEMLAGRPPLVGSMEQLMYQHFTVQPPPPSTYNTLLPAAVDAVLLRALAKKPEDRFPSIVAFASALEQAMRLGPVEMVVGPRPSSVGDITKDVRTTLAISQAEAHSGTSRVITLPGGLHVNVTVPAGVSDGQVIRLRDLGEPSSPVGELILTIAIAPSKEVQRSPATLSAEQTLLTSPPGGRQPFDPSSDHDLPTVASLSPNLRVPQKQEQPPLPKKRPASRSRSVAIISGLIILLLLAGLAGTVYFYNGYQANVNAIAHSQTATALAQAPKPTTTVPITPTATPQNGLYIAGTYNGSMTDGVTQQATSISVLIMQSKGNGTLGGTFTFRSPSQGTYPLKGTIDLQGKFSFTVQQSAGQTPLYFYGTVQQDVYLHGFYCSSSTNSCGPNPGFFTVGPKF
jgi:serine/threonine protein kinase